MGKGIKVHVFFYNLKLTNKPDRLLPFFMINHIQPIRLIPDAI